MAHKGHNPKPDHHGKNRCYLPRCIYHLILLAALPDDRLHLRARQVSWLAGQGPCSPSLRIAAKVAIEQVLSAYSRGGGYGLGLSAAPHSLIAYRHADRTKHNIM